MHLQPSKHEKKCKQELLNLNSANIYDAPHHKPIFMLNRLFLFKRVSSLLALTALFFCANARAVLDNGVDPANLGTGDWIYFLQSATSGQGGHAEEVTDVPSLMSFYKKHGIEWLAIKAGTGAEDFPADQPQFTKELVDAAHAAGIKIFGYTRSNGKNVPGEIELAAKIYNLGADGFILDAEAEWESSRLGDKGPELAVQLCSGIKERFPNKFLGHAPFPIISKHASFPYKEFGFYCDAVMPQAYWKSIGVTPTRMVEWMDEEWDSWQSSLRGKWIKAIKPLAPIGQGWSPTTNEIVTGEEITEFIAALNHDKHSPSPGGYNGVSYWRTDLHTKIMWKAIRTARIGHPETSPATIVKQSETPAHQPKQAKTTFENPNDFTLNSSSSNVVFSGAWHARATKDGKQESRYMAANAVSGKATATAEYHPLIRNTGYYDIFVWHRSNPKFSRNAPWVVTYKGESFTNHINQTQHGRQWVPLAESLHFSAGTNVVVSISNNSGESADRAIVADAIRFVRKEETPEDSK
jgi:hypothetical protein